MSDLKGYEAAQAAYERQQPDYWNDAGWCECAACNGTGLLGNDTEEECALCAGEGGWDEYGEPISDRAYEARKDREPVRREGSLDFLACPTRINDTLYYRDGRSETLTR